MLPYVSMTLSLHFRLSREIVKFISAQKEEHPVLSVFLFVPLFFFLFVFLFLGWWERQDDALAFPVRLRLEKSTFQDNRDFRPFHLNCR